MSQYLASTLNVSVNLMNQIYTCCIDDITWNGTNFNGQIDGININGTDINGNITATGTYLGHTYTETGKVLNWN